MLKLIKYEIQERYKLLLGMAILMIASNIYYYMKISSWDIISGDQINNMPTAFLVSSITEIIIFTVLFVSSINMFSKDLYSDTAYLKYTLPQSGLKITTSKLITALINFIMLGIIAILFVPIFLKREMSGLNYNFLMKTLSINKNMVAYLILISVVSLLSLLILIYFSITLSKVAINKRKHGKVTAFAIFIVLSIIGGYINYNIVKYFPYKFDIGIKIGEALQNGSIRMHFESFEINIASTIFNIIVYLGMFFGTGYLLDNKVDI